MESKWKYPSLVIKTKMLTLNAHLTRVQGHAGQWIQDSDISIGLHETSHFCRCKHKSASEQVWR